MSELTETFGEVIYAYTRKQAIEDGEQVEVPTELSREAGLKWPIFLTRTVWDRYVEVPEGVECQDVTGRLWDILCMLRFGIHQSPRGQNRIPFSLHVRNDNSDECEPPLITLAAVADAVDIDNPAPSITVMLPEED